MAYSLHSQECFNKVLTHSLRSAASDILDASSLSESAANDADLSKHVMSRIMLTIAGIDFRITFLLHYADSQAIRGIIKSTSSDEGVPASSVEHSEELDAYFLEMGNRLCGEAKRLCYESFDHLGMSTPCVLSERTTLADMHNDDLKCEGHVVFQQMDKTLMAGSVFVYSKCDLELALDESHFAEQEGTGELEFF